MSALHLLNQLMDPGQTATFQQSDWSVDKLFVLWDFEYSVKVSKI